MTDRPHETPPARGPLESAFGLRLRLWLAAMAGGLVAGLGLLWVLGTQWTPGGDPFDLFGWLTAVAVFATLTGFAMALWLDHHIVGQLRGLLAGLLSGRVAEFRGLPATTGWGELSEVSEITQGLLARHRHAARAVTELEHTRRHLEALQDALERWLVSERWHEPTLEAGPVSTVVGVLGRGLSRRDQLDEQHRDIATQLAREVTTALADAQETAEQAERGFVEATAMLTTVRELQRLSQELHNGLAAAGAPAPGGDADARLERWRETTRGALEELVSASQSSVDAIAAGLLRVQDIAAHVQRMGNRATLIAIHAMSPRPTDPAEAEAAALELQNLAREVRHAMERTSALAGEVDGDVRRATEIMQGVRARAAERLEAAPPRSEPEMTAGRRWEDVHHLLERVREMVQDAARKGERLSSAGERASRAAERLVRRLEDDAHEAEALAVRLEPVAPADDADAGSPAPAAAHPPDLRVLAAEPAADDDADPRAGEDVRHPEERP